MALSSTIAEYARVCPISVIQSADPLVEHAYVKFPGVEAKPVSIDETLKSATINYHEYVRLYQKHGKKSCCHIHTHPRNHKISPIATKYPSDQDLFMLLVDNCVRTMVIAERDTETGEVTDYFFLRKTRKTPCSRYSPVELAQFFGKQLPLELSHLSNVGELESMVQLYDFFRYTAINYDNEDMAKMALDALAADFHLKYRRVHVRDAV